jgi:N-methylhydantoinase B
MGIRLSDPATFTIVTHSFAAIAREMSADLLRTAYSTVIREAADASTALFDRQGRTIAQAVNIPLHLNSMEPAFAACADKLGYDGLEPDTVWVLNDPYHGGQHLSDIFFFSPILVDQELVGFAGSVGHYVDLGHTPGFNSRARDIFEERMRFDRLQFSIERDWNGGLLEQLIEMNVRMPEYTLGDLNAQLVANRTGAMRLAELHGRYGTQMVERVIEEYLDYAEEEMRREIEQTPDGRYEATTWLDDDGVNEGAIGIPVQLEIRGSEIVVSFDGVAGETNAAINCPLASTHSAVRGAIRCIFANPNMPVNSGCYRPIVIKDPPLGSILNPTPFHPVEGRNMPVIRVFTAVTEALAQALPERVPAPGYDTRTAIDLHYSYPDGRYLAVSDLYGGGYGAGPHNDGADQTDDPLGNCTNTPVEAFEVEQDYFLITNYELLQDSGGAGRRRGGLGARRTYEILKDNVFMTIYSDHFAQPAPGLFGGRPGSLASCTLHRGQEHIAIVSKGSLYLQAGDLVEMCIGGGGGYRPPAQRELELVERDLREGKISERAAIDTYEYDHRS